MKFKFKKSNSNLICIQKPAIIGDVGYDIYSAEKKIVKKKSSALIKTGLSIELPLEYWFEIMPKSGLAVNKSISVHNGVIDNGYRGEIVIFLYNHSNQDYTFEINEKIAQGVIRKSYILELEKVDELSDSKRGFSGFGSTGK